MEIHTHTFNRFSGSGISTFCHWSQGLAKETWNPKCKSRHSPFLTRNANGNPSSETSRALATSSLAVGCFVAKQGSLRSPRGQLVASLLIYLDPSDLRSVILIRIIPKESTHNLCWKSYHLQNWDISLFFYPFLTTSTSRFRISHFLPFWGRQVCHLKVETFADVVAKMAISFSVADIYFTRIETILHVNINIIVQ